MELNELKKAQDDIIAAFKLSPKDQEIYKELERLYHKLEEQKERERKKVTGLLPKSEDA